MLVSQNEVNEINGLFLAYQEKAAITAFRKNISNIFSSFSSEVQLGIALAFDKSLVVSLDNALESMPIISGVNTDKMLEGLSKLISLGSTSILTLSKSAHQCNIEAEKQNTVFRANVRGRVDMYCYTSGILDKGEILELSKAVQSGILSYGRALYCLVFKFGMKVVGAQYILDNNVSN